MDETGRAGRGVRAEKNAQLLQIDRFGDVEEVQHPEIAARDYPCGTDVPEMWLCRWCDSHRRLDAWTRRRRTQGVLVLKKKDGNLITTCRRHGSYAWASWGAAMLRPYGGRYAAGRSSTLIQPGSRRSKSL